MAAGELQTRSSEVSGWVSRSCFVHFSYAFSALPMFDWKFDDEAAVEEE
jgi:hypothetical protein